MSLLDKARRYAQKNPAGVERGLGKATDAINRKTGNKHASTLSKVQQGVRKFTGGSRPRRDV